MADLPNRPLHVAEVAQYWSVSTRTIYLWIEHKHLETITTPSGSIRVTRESALTCRLIKTKPDAR